jgi:hypothetical protein
MKHRETVKTGRPATRRCTGRLALGFSRLDEKGQAYIENLTAQLAKIHSSSPENTSSDKNKG